MSFLLDSSISNIIYTCIHTYIHTCTHTLTHTHSLTHTYIHTCIQTHSYTCTIAALGLANPKRPQCARGSKARSEIPNDLSSSFCAGVLEVGADGVGVAGAGVIDARNTVALFVAQGAAARDAAALRADRRDAAGPTGVCLGIALVEGTAFGWRIANTPCQQLGVRWGGVGSAS